MKDIYQEYDEICKFVKGLDVFTALTIANKFDMSVFAAKARIEQMVKEGKVEKATNSRKYVNIEIY